MQLSQELIQKVAWKFPSLKKKKKKRVSEYLRHEKQFPLTEK